MRDAVLFTFILDSEGDGAYTAKFFLTYCAEGCAIAGRKQKVTTNEL